MVERTVEATPPRVRCTVAAYYAGESAFSERHAHLPKIIAFWLFSVVGKLLPCLVFTVFCLLLVRGLSAHRRRAEESMMQRQMRSKSIAPTPAECVELIENAKEEISSRRRASSSVFAAGASIDRLENAQAETAPPVQLLVPLGRSERSASTSVAPLASSSSHTSIDRTSFLVCVMLAVFIITVTPAGW